MRRPATVSSEFERIRSYRLAGDMRTGRRGRHQTVSIPQRHSLVTDCSAFGPQVRGFRMGYQTHIYLVTRLEDHDIATKQSCPQ